MKSLINGTCFRKKNESLISQDLNGPLSRCDQHKLCPLCTLIIPYPMFWDFKTFISSLYVSLVNNFPQHMCISHKSPCRMQVNFENERELSLGCCVSSSDFGAPCIGVRVGRKKSTYLNLVKALHYITMGLFCPQKLGTAYIKMILI